MGQGCSCRIEEPRDRGRGCPGPSLCSGGKYGVARRNTELDADSSLSVRVYLDPTIGTVYPGQVKASPAGQVIHMDNPMQGKFYGKFLRGLTPSLPAAVK